MQLCTTLRCLLACVDSQKEKQCSILVPSMVPFKSTLFHVHIFRVMPAFLWRDTMISIESAFVSPSFLCVFVSSQVPSQAGLVFFIVLFEFICHRRFPGRPLASPACSLLECNGHRQKKKVIAAGEGLTEREGAGIFAVLGKANGWGGRPWGWRGWG